MTQLLEKGTALVRQHGLWLTAVLSVAAFLFPFLVSDAAEVADVLFALEPWRVGAMFGLTTVSYGIRFLKWEYYLRELDVTVGSRMSLLVFLSGLMMVITPGKAGEVWKSWFLRDLRGVPVSRTV